MSILNKPISPLRKGTKYTFTLQKADIMALPKVSSHPYYSNPLNWKTVVITYRSVEGRQHEVVSFHVDNEQNLLPGKFLVSVKARDSYFILNLTIHDFDGGYLIVDRFDIPDASDHDIILSDSDPTPDPDPTPTPDPTPEPQIMEGPQAYSHQVDDSGLLSLKWNPPNPSLPYGWVAQHELAVDGGQFVPKATSMSHYNGNWYDATYLELDKVYSVRSRYTRMEGGQAVEYSKWSQIDNIVRTLPEPIITQPSSNNEWYATSTHTKVGASGLSATNGDMRWSHAYTNFSGGEADFEYHFRFPGNWQLDSAIGLGHQSDGTSAPVFTGIISTGGTSVKITAGGLTNVVGTSSLRSDINLENLFIVKRVNKYLTMELNGTIIYSAYSFTALSENINPLARLVGSGSITSSTQVHHPFAKYDFSLQNYSGLLTGSFVQEGSKLVIRPSAGAGALNQSINIYNAHGTYTLKIYVDGNTLPSAPDSGRLEGMMANGMYGTSPYPNPHLLESGKVYSVNVVNGMTVNAQFSFKTNMGSSLYTSEHKITISKIELYHQYNV